MKNTLIKAANAAGEIIRDNFEGNYKIESKDVISNLVTEIDKKAEAKIIETIKADFPGHSILSEEIGSLEEDSNIKWIIDPIDGTINFAHSIPICSVSIGVEKDGEIIMGVVYNPISEEFFFAEKGAGAYLNDNKISVSKTEKLSTSLLVTGFPYNTSKNPRNPIGVFADITLMDIPIRRLGSAAIDICWVACGRFDGFWEYNLNPWDVAAGSLIIKEAGGTISDFDGGKYSIYENEILCTNGVIHNELRDVIRNAVKDREG